MERAEKKNKDRPWTVDTDSSESGDKGVTSPVSFCRWSSIRFLRLLMNFFYVVRRWWDTLAAWEACIHRRGAWGAFSGRGEPSWSLVMKRTVSQHFHGLFSEFNIFCTHSVQLLIQNFQFFHQFSYLTRAVFAGHWFKITRVALHGEIKISLCPEDIGIYGIIIQESFFVLTNVAVKVDPSYFSVSCGWLLLSGCM